VTPLHRLANWDFRNGRGPFVLFLLNWAVVGLFSFFGAVFRLTTAWQPASPWVVFAIILFPVALIQSGVPWKLSHHAMYLVWQAKERGLWTHMGRANSGKRFRRAVEMQVDSADGNFLRWPSKNAQRLRAMLDGLNDEPQLALA